MSFCSLEKMLDMPTYHFNVSYVEDLHQASTLITMEIHKENLKIHRMLVNQEKLEKFSTKLQFQMKTKSLEDKIGKRRKLLKS